MTLIIPLWNEEETLTETLDRLCFYVSRYEWQVIIIDDGSSDNTAAIAQEYAERCKNIKVYSIPHSGKDAAMWEGIKQSKSEWLGFMDGDGQYNPGDIIALMNHAAKTNCDAVWGIRKTRQDNFLRIISSKLALLIKKKILRHTVVSDPGCGISIAKSKYMKEIIQICNNPHGQLHCHLSELIYALGGSVKEIDITHQRRKRGKAKYGLLNRIGPGITSLCQAKKCLKTIISDDTRHKKTLDKLK